MTIIDHTSHPHIIDRVFDYAPVGSLSVMNRVSRECRDDVAKRFYHVEGLVGNWDRSKSFYYFNAIGTQATTDWSLLRGCQVLDVARGSVPDFHRCFPQLKTIRMSRMAVSFIPEKWRGYVLPNDTRLVYNNTYYDLPFKNQVKVKKVVINVRDDRFVVCGEEHTPWPDDVRFPEDMRSLVVIIHNKAASLKARVILSYYVNDVILRDYRFPDLILVGPPPELGDYMRTSLISSGSPFDIRFMEMDAYKASVGEKEFAIETDFTYALTP